MKFIYIVRFKKGFTVQNKALKLKWCEYMKLNKSQPAQVGLTISFS